MTTLLHVNPPGGSSILATSARIDVDPLVDSLYELIRKGELSPGQRVDQRDVADRLQVSRTPLREALRAMAADGVLVRTPNAGYAVAKLSAADLLQYYSMRTFLETEVLRTIEWPDAEQLAALKEANEACREAAGDVTLDRLVASNRAFHLMMFSWSPLTIMYKEILRVWRVSEPYRVLHLSNPERRRRVAADHDQMIAAIEEEDGKRLIRLMDEHRGRSRGMLQDMLGPALAGPYLSLPQGSRRGRQP
ncbi:GntR family transcriptional regulator [Spirillospora sp. CA-255316]